MSRKNLALCKLLFDQGAYADAWIMLIELKRENTEDIEAINRLANEGGDAYQADYVNVRTQLHGIIQESDCLIQISACLEAMTVCEDFVGLESCKNLEIKIDDSNFFMDFSDYIDGHIIFYLTRNSEFFPLSPSFIDGVQTKRHFFSSSFLYSGRAESDVRTPLYNCVKRLELGTRVWAVDFDSMTGRYIMTLPQESRVIGVNAKTLETEATMESPLDGLRGVCVFPKLRRGFYNSMYGNQMISFDLDEFKIRKQIKGFSVRPERIRADAKTNTIITGNLGWGLMLAFVNEKSLHRLTCTDDGKVTDGESITIVDAEAESVTHTIAAGRRPTAVAISDKYIVAGNFHDNSLTIYERNDLSASCVISLDVIPDTCLNFQIEDKYEGRSFVLPKRARSRVVEGIAIAERRGWVLVSGWDACILTVVDIQARKVKKVIPVQNNPFDVVVDDQENYAYVSCYGSHQVSVVDLNQGCEVCRLQTGKKPVDLRLIDGSLLVADSTGLNIFDLNQLPLEELNGGRHGWAALR